MPKNIRYRGEAPEGRLLDVTNRTGGNIVTNDVLVLDTLQADAASTSIGEGFSNVLDPATANLLSKAVVYQDSATVADDGELRVSTDGIVSAKVNGAISKGDRLEIVNGQNYLQTIAVGSGARTARVQAIAMEANTSGAAVKQVLLLAEPAYVYLAS